MIRCAPPYRGWVLVAALAVTETISYGTLVYAFTVFLAPMRAELGWSIAALTGAFSLGLLVAGFAAVPMGRWLDAHGARLSMSAGSALAAALLLAWSHAASLWAYYAVWAGLGLAMAAVLYEPAFVVLAVWFRRDRGKALTVLTFVAGFASVIFIPLAGHLVESLGWRAALRTLALVQLATLPLHALLLRRRPEDLGLEPDGRAPDPGRWEPEGPSPAEAFRQPTFRRLALAFSLSTFVVTAVGVHLVPMLVQIGHGPGFAAVVGGAIGLVALPGRLALTPLGDVWPRRYVAAGIFAVQAAGLAVLLLGAGAAVWVFVALYGAGFGALTPARAALLADAYGGLHYGRISGRMALINALARAAAPLLSGVVVSVAGGYGMLLGVLAGLAGLAGLTVGAARPPAPAGAVEARA